MNNILDLTYHYILSDEKDKIITLWENNKETYISLEDFYQFIERFSISQRNMVSNCININGTGASPCLLPNLSSLTALYASQISKQNFVKTGSGANTGIHGSSDFFRDIGLLNLDSQSILDEYHFLYYDYLILSPWKKYKPVMAQNKYLGDYFKQVFFFDYPSKYYFLGLNSVHFYDSFTRGWELYNRPEHLVIYYTNQNDKIYDEVYSGVVHVDNKPYFTLPDHNNKTPVSASTIHKINAGLVDGSEDSDWKMYLGYSVALVLEQMNHVQSIDEGYELFEKCYRDKVVKKMITKILSLKK